MGSLILRSNGRTGDLGDVDKEFAAVEFLHLGEIFQRIVAVNRIIPVPLEGVVVMDNKDTNLLMSLRQVTTVSLTGGQGELGGNDFIEYNHDPGSIMHELGHNLNLQHGGNDPINCKPNYISVMNYDNQFGIRQNAGSGQGQDFSVPPDGTLEIIDYSPPRFPNGRGSALLPPLVENTLNEATILDSTDASNQFIYTSSLSTLI